MTYDLALNADVIITGVLALAWTLVAWLVGGLIPAPSLRLRRRALSAVAAGGVALVVLALKLGTTAVIAAQGWLFVADRIVLVLPMLLPPAAAFAAVTVPALLRGARALREGDRGPAGPGVRRALAAPPVALPAQLTALAGGFALYADILRMPVPPYSDDMAVLWVPFAAVALGLAMRAAGRRARLVRDGEPARRRLLPRVLRSTGVTVAVLLTLAGLVVTAARASLLPATHSMADMPGMTGAMPDMPGMAGMAATSGPAVAPVSVTQLTGPPLGPPDHVFTLVARKAPVRLTSGGVVSDGWTFNGQSPGPLLRARQGEVVRIVVRNQDVEAGVSAHWHGMDVPNAEDGVPGLTQDAIYPGQSFTYDFRLDDAGTYWYHSHQQASEQVDHGLYGMFVVDPAGPAPDPAVVDIPVIQHTWKLDDGRQVRVLDTDDGLAHRKIAPGTRVRLRLLNVDNSQRTFGLAGTPFTIPALDSSPVNGPTPLEGQLVPVGGGGRATLEFTMPDHPVRLADAYRPDQGIAFSPDGTGDVAAQTTGPLFDLTHYGTPAPTPFGPDSHFDQVHDEYLDNEAGFFDGRLGLLSVINGESYPDIPTITVREGDLVKVRFINRTRTEHPMHLHGHHVLVLSRDGRPVTGSPIWLDTVTVPVGETWEVAFRADNPGVWMDHCHNLEHAANGMVMHLTYVGVTSPFDVGSATLNHPE